MPFRQGPSAACGRRLALLALVLVALGAPASAEQRPTGTEMWFAWPRTPNPTFEDPGYDADGELVVLTESATPVAFTVETTGFRFDGTASSAAPGRVRLPRSLMMTTNGVIEPKGIHVTARGCAQVAALARVPGTASSIADDVMTLLPTTILDTEYYPETYNGMAEFVVVATEDATRVTWNNPWCPGAVDLVLDAGEAVQHLCDNDRTIAAQRGIAGTHVVADKPVALIEGNNAANIVHYLVPGVPTNLEITWCCGDVLLEQARPTSDWERSYRTVPFHQSDPNAPGDVIRIQAACDDTEVEVDDGVSIRSRTLAAGETWELVEADLVARTFTLADLPLMIDATKPIQVNQYSVGFLMTLEGDPAQVVVPGLLRPVGAHRFFVPEESNGWASVVVPVSAVSSVALDGAPVAASAFTAYPDGRHAWASLGPLAVGQHRITTPSVPASVLAYGFTFDPGTRQPQAGQHAYPAPSFGPAGTFPVLVHSGDACTTHCPGECFDLDAGPGYATQDWSTGESTRTISVCPLADASYTVDVTDINGCAGLGVLDVAVAPGPAPDITGDLVACGGGCVDLAIASGFASVLWSTGETTDAIRVCPGAGGAAVDVEVTSADGCTGSDHVDVAVLLDPIFDGAVAADASPCGLGIRLTWPLATWRNIPASGVYHVYRSMTDCAAALASPPIVMNLSVPTYTDATTSPGGTYVYVVMAEDDAGPSACGDGPHHGGLTATSCATLVVDLVDRRPPAQDAMATLRGDGHAGNAIGFRWDAAPALLPGEGEHFHLHRASSPFGPFVRLTPEGFTSRAFVDADGGAAPLLFYDLRIADSCENATEDPWPPTRCHGNACQQPELARGHPFSWDTCSPGCPSAFASHACGPGPAAGVDRVHRFETLAAAAFRATLDAERASLDVFLYDDALGSCLGWGDASIALASLPAGRWALVVDGPVGSEGSYALAWETLP